MAAIAVIRSAPSTTRAASYANHSPLGAVDHFYTRPGGLRAIGWDFDPDAKHTALLTVGAVDHRRVASTTADLVRRDVAANYPKAGPDHGFSFFVPVPEGKHLVCIRARNIGAGSNYRMRCTTMTFDFGPHGAIDPVTTKPGHLLVSGWAIDQDKATAPVTVVVKLDGVASAPIVANRYRKDVADKHPAAGGHHGFLVSLPATQGKHTVCVTARNIGYGTDNSLGCRTVTLNDDPRAALESVTQRSGKLRVVGWAFDRDAPTTSLTVHINVDGTTHTMVADTARPDIAQKYPGVGKYHGYVASYALAEGRHKVCVTVVNIGFGSNAVLPCKTGTLSFTPTAATTSLTATATGATVRGWATDPNTRNPISVTIKVDGHAVTTVTADGSGSKHNGHYFTVPLTLKSGRHKVCAIALNASYGTQNSVPSCRTITLALRPIGKFESLKRVSGSNSLTVTGWTLDPDTRTPITADVLLDGSGDGTVTAKVRRTDIAAKYPAYGADHGISATINADSGEHTVCLTAVNVGGGSDTSLGCKLIIAVHPVPPSAPRNVTAIAGYGAAQVSWTRPASDGGAPWTKYTVVASPGGRTVTVDAASTTALVTGLKPSTKYSFAVRAVNVAGASPARVSPQVKTQANPPAQRTPAPVSTSRYIRNIRDASATERATMRAEGAKDAYYNPSGHGYLVLLDIGGQDQFDGGVVLSATTRFVSYADLVSDLKAYVAGYHSKQKPSAPAVIALGTNNDMDVSSASGRAWATKVVGPVATYVRNHFGGITIAGANDIEPGFRATYRQTKSWLGGYLGATRSPFVFNGSADGCSWTAINRGCNNHWSMSGLYYLAAGAAPVRMLNLPQIYNTTMAAQWKYISLTGLVAGHPRIHFVGPLTEWTACDQTNSCGSLTGHSAWSAMWKNLQSDSRLKVSSLPYSTDLRIDK